MNQWYKCLKQGVQIREYYVYILTNKKYNIIYRSNKRYSKKIIKIAKKYKKVLICLEFC